MKMQQIFSEDSHTMHKKVDSNHRFGYTEINMAGPSAFVYGSAFYILG